MRRGDINRNDRLNELEIPGVKSHSHDANRRQKWRNTIINPRDCARLPAMAGITRGGLGNINLGTNEEGSGESNESAKGVHHRRARKSVG